MKLNYPLPLQEKLRFALREGGKTVAAGVVTKILEDSEADIKEEEERAAKTKKKWLVRYPTLPHNLISYFKVYYYINYLYIKTRGLLGLHQEPKRQDPP